MALSWLLRLKQKRVNLSALIAILLFVLIFSLIFFDYMYFTDRPLPIVSAPLFKNIYGEPSFLAEIDRFQDEGLRGPSAVAGGPDGKIYVVDTGSSRVLVFSHDGKPLLKFGKGGTTEGEFNYPYAIAVDEADRIYVGQFKSPRIQVFDAQGKFLRKIDASTAGVNVAPLALALDKEGKIYAANQDGKILVLGQDGKLIKSFGGPGGADGFLSYPKGIALSGDQIYVSDTNNGRVQIFNLDGKLLKVVRGSELKVQMPTGISVAEDGTIFLVDSFGSQVNAYDNKFSLLSSTGSKGSGDGELNFPVGIAVDNYGKLVVADMANDRVSVFQR